MWHVDNNPETLSHHLRPESDPSHVMPGNNQRPVETVKSYSDIFYARQLAQGKSCRIEDALGHFIEASIALSPRPQ